MGGDRDDNPLRLIVREFDGRKGPEYTAWRKELLDALAGKGDDDASLADTVMKKDRRAGLSAAEAKRRKTRIRQAYAHIIAPLTDPDLKSVLRDEAFQDGVAALEVLDRECGDSQSALRQNQRILEWHATTIPKDVGIQESSIVDLSRKLTTQNEAMGKLFSADETTEKILGADNTAAIDIVKAYCASGRSKHFERWIAYIRDLYQRHVIEIFHLATDKMPADIFTKALPRESYVRFRDTLLGMRG